MIAVDSSIWIGHFRNAISAKVRLLRALFGREPLLVGDIVFLEVLRGACDDRHAARLARDLRAFDIVPMLGDVIASQPRQPATIERCERMASQFARRPI